MSDPSHVQIGFPLTPDEDGWPPVGRECVWARPTPDGHFQILSLPFFPAGVHRHDVVAAVPADGDVLEFVSVVRSSGHRTVVALAADYETACTFQEQLSALGCAITRGDEQLFAVDLPPQARGSELAQALRAAERSEQLVCWTPDESCVFCLAAGALDGGAAPPAEQHIPSRNSGLVTGRARAPGLAAARRATAAARVRAGRSFRRAFNR